MIQSPIGWIPFVGPRNRRAILVALCAVAFLPIFSVLIIAASLPRIAWEFGVSESRAGLLLALNLLGLALGFLLGGPVQNRFGERTAVIAGIAWLGALSALTASVQAFLPFLLLRLLQAVAAGVALCGIGPIIRITWDGDPTGAARANVAVTTATALGPILGLPAGAALALHADWRLGVMGVAGLAVAVAAIAWLTLPVCRVRETPGSHGHTGAEEGTSRSAAGLVGALSLAVVYAFMTASPIILLSMWGLARSSFGILSVLPPCCMLAVGILVRSALARGRLSLATLAPLAAMTHFLAGAGFFVVALSAVPQVSLFVLCCMGCAAANGLLLAYSVMLALQRLPRNRLGSASALIGFMQMAGAGVGSALVSLAPMASAMALASVVLTASVANMALVWRLRDEGAL